MLFSFLLVTFGVYLGQEYQNLPMVKTIVLNLVSYMHKLNQDSKRLEHSSSSSSSSSSVTYLSFFKKFYDLLTLKKTDINTNTDTNLNAYSFSSLNESNTPSNLFFETSDNLRKRTHDDLENE